MQATARAPPSIDEPLGPNASCARWSNQAQRWNGGCGGSNQLFTATMASIAPNPHQILALSSGLAGGRNGGDSGFSRCHGMRVLASVTWPLVQCIGCKRARRRSTARLLQPEKDQLLEQGRLRGERLESVVGDGDVGAFAGGQRGGDEVRGQAGRG